MQAVNHSLERVEKYDGYQDGKFKGFDLLRQLVKPVIQAFEVRPRRPCETSKEKGEEDRGKDILVRTAYPLEERCFNASGQWISGNGACRDGIQFAYTTARIGTS
jgi:hypothetical protein